MSTVFAATSSASAASSSASALPATPAGSAAITPVSAIRSAEEGLVPLARELFANPETRAAACASGLCLALWVGVFWATLTNLVFVWRTNENYGHGFLVPLMSLYFANEALKRGRPRIRGGMALGLGLLAVSILRRWAAVLVPVGVVGDLSLLIGLAGIVTMLAGVDALKRFWFPLAFLLFMVPLPVAVYTAIANPLQLMVSKIATALLTLMGIPAYCEGNMMTLAGGIRMFVAEACSGMRQLTGFLALSAAIAYLAQRPWWYRAFLILASIPIALTANVIRVVATGWIMFKVDPKYASGSFHTIEGLALMGLGLGMLLGIQWIVDQLIIFDDKETAR